MIGAVLKWLRWRYWDFEDAITDVLDWQPRPTPPIKPLPAPPSEPHKHVPFHFTGVTFQRATAEQANAEMLRQVLHAIGKNIFVEIRYDR
jgi:hypothetical protein